MAWEGSLEIPFDLDDEHFVQAFAMVAFETFVVAVFSFDPIVNGRMVQIYFPLFQYPVLFQFEAGQLEN
jgi:hypothetical protein